MDKEVLKQKLLQLTGREQCETVIAKEELLFSMLPYLGDHDPVLRDKLIYGLASKWVTDGLISPKVMKQILEELLTNQYLFNGEEKYSRSFAALWIAAILYRHRKEAFLSEADIERIYQALLACIQQETVGEGYDDAYGWLHTIAHAADALDELILLTEITVEQRQQIVKEIINKMAFPHHILSCEEDERMAIAVHSALRNGVDPEMIGSMVKEKASEVTALWPEVNEANLLIRSNFKLFIRSLYFSLSDFPDLQMTVFECEQLFSGIYHNKPSF